MSNRVLFFSFVFLFSAGYFSPAFSYELQEPVEYDFTDVQMWYSGDGPQRLAIGACYGPFMEVVNSDGVRLGEVFRPCLMLTYDTVNSTGVSESESGGFGLNLFSVMGFTGSVFQDPIEGEWKFGVGVSITSIYRQFKSTETLKPQTTKFRKNLLRPPPSYSREAVRSLVARLDPSFTSFR